MKQNKLFMVGLSSICIGIWFLAESRIITLFYDNPINIMYIAYITIITSVKVFHVILITNILIEVYTVLRAAIKGDPEARIFAFGVILMSLTGIHDIIIIFYATPGWLYTESLTHWGI